MIENKMIACETHAIRFEDSGHNLTNKNGPTNRKPSPKKAHSGLLYGLSSLLVDLFFEDGSGSANGGCYK